VVVVHFIFSVRGCVGGRYVSWLFDRRARDGRFGD